MSLETKSEAAFEHLLLAIETEETIMRSFINGSTEQTPGGM